MEFSSKKAAVPPATARSANRSRPDASSSGPRGSQFAVIHGRKKPRSEQPGAHSIACSGLHLVGEAEDAVRIHPLQLLAKPLIPNEHWVAHQGAPVPRWAGALWIAVILGYLAMVAWFSL